MQSPVRVSNITMQNKMKTCNEYVHNICMQSIYGHNKPPPYTPPLIINILIVELLYYIIYNNFSFHP